MPQWLKQSTSITEKIGPFLDDTDGFTPETALTITQPDIRLSKNGGAFAQKAAAQTLTHDEKGFYGLTLDATDTDTLGSLKGNVDKSGALPVFFDFMVVPANVWDSMFGSDKLQIDLAEWLGTAAATPSVAGVPEVDLTHVAGAVMNALVSGRMDCSVGAMAAAVVTAAAIATDAIGSAEFSQAAADKIWLSAARTLTALGFNLATTDFAAGAIDAAAIATDARDKIARAINPQQNAALSDIEFEMYDSTNHNPSTGLTVTGQRSIDGGAYAAVSGTIAEVGNGTYQFDAVAADMNGALVTFRFSAAATDDTFVHVKTAA